MARLFFISLFFTFSLLISSVLGYTQNSSAINFDNGLDAWESEDSELNQIHVLPCVPVNGSVKQFKTDVLIVKRNFTECSGHDSQYSNALLRVTTQSNINTSDPVVFVTRDGSSIETWHLPLRLQTFDTPFSSANRTTCATSITDNSTSMYIDVFTSSRDDVEYNVNIEPVKNFSLQLKETIGFYVAANAPQLYHFKFPEGVSSVKVLVTSNTSICAIVSVQNATCPVNDLLENARSKGVYQTMTKDASLTITADETIKGNDFFIVVVTAHASLCHKLELIPLIDPSHRELQYVEMTIEELKPASEYKYAIVAPLLCFIFVGIVAAAFFLCPCCHCTWRPFVFSRKCCSVSSTCGKNDDSECEYLLVNSRKLVPKQNSGLEEDEEEEREDEDSVLIRSGENRRLLKKKETSIKLIDLLKEDPDSLEERYKVYGWNTITVGIFYGLPAFQLILSEQLILNSTGDQDTCYYNFRCAHPWSILSAFNNIWSNIGYFIFGLAFLAIIMIRHFKARQLKLKDEEYYHKHGIPQFFGIYYAMGIALVLEGFMSGFYHICPSGSNFQFDTAFMFIIGGLLIVKILQSRHPDIHANAFIAFFCFAVIIFLTLIGIWEGSRAYWQSRWTIYSIILMGVAVFCISFYFYHDWRSGHLIELNTYKRIWRWFRSWCVPCTSKENCYRMKPQNVVRFIKMLTAVILNIVLGIMLVLSDKGIATVILGLFVSNFMLFMLIYIVCKIYYREKFTVMPVVLLVILTVCWGSAFYFYFNNVSEWEASPAESRERNKNCVLMGFYDNHDVWHFLSAAAMFFSFLFLLTLDDGMRSVQRKDIHVF